MPYIGSRPPPSALTASDIADGIVSNAKLAQDIISAETALGAEPADTDELLVSDAGTLKRMDYSHIKGGAGLVKLVTTTISGTSTAAVTFDDTYITATYKNYLIKGYMIPISDNRYPKAQFLVSGSAVSTSAYYGYEAAATASSAYNSTNGATSITLSPVAIAGNASDEGCAWQIWFNNPLSTTFTTTLNAQMDGVNSSGDHMGCNASACANTLEAHNGIKLYFDSGNLTADSYLTLYGITN